MISYVLPTRDRPERLIETLRGLDRLGDHRAVDGAEVIIVDNASDRPAASIVKSVVGCCGELKSGVLVRVVRLRENRGAAARNEGVKVSDPASEWIVMLDDDSWPTSGVDFAARLRTRSGDVAAVMADIHLPRKKCREAGGLPEVFIGCGVAIRRAAFLRAGGYDAAFGYYAEEYDLAAKILLAGHRVEFDRSWRVDHQKDDRHRDMNLICERLVRNNGWVMQRYAPDVVRRAELREIRGRYRRIAEKENALKGYTRGLVELRRTIRTQQRTPMPREIWERFTGLAHARAALQKAWRARRFNTAALVDEGKNAGVIRAALAELGVREVGTGLDRAEALVIGTMSPGPMLDVVEKWNAEFAISGAVAQVIAPWAVMDHGAKAHAA